MQAEYDSLMVRYMNMINTVCNTELANVSKLIEDGVIPAIFNNLKQRIPINSSSIYTVMQLFSTISTPEKGQAFIKDYVNDLYVKLIPMCLDPTIFEALRDIRDPCQQYFNTQGMIKLIRNMPDFKDPTQEAVLKLVKKMQELGLTCVKKYYEFVLAKKDSTNFTKIDVLGHEVVEVAPEFE